MTEQTQTQKFDASLSVLAMSIASSAAMSMGLVPYPHDNESKIDKELAKFNIDLLIMLQGKTKGNATEDEKQFLASLVSDLQMKYIQIGG